MRVRMILAFLVLAVGALVAQTFRGTILGTVTDQSGAIVAGATVTVRNVATGLERPTQTSADGSYSVPELPTGSYTVTIKQTGFQNGRDYTKLIYLNPGVAGSPDQISESPGSFGTFSMNGSRGRANNLLLDGTEMNDGFRNESAFNDQKPFACLAFPLFVGSPT
jgi:Carboxypeptidase regulatory-like domain/TonB-dependent Receptor Plug Domain